jgi:hypothetical protein
VLIAVAGALGGALLAWLLAAPFNLYFQWRFDTALVFVRVTPAVALQAVAVSVPFGILAGLAATWTLLRRPLTALLGR